ncbi:M50 family metallopeptidase [Sphingomonas hankyongi]|uniref:M50 family metallopeptidase n=1 Tax=Sphingomonas hankyongi TaxID=2908209 RepID=A0ABT0S3U1_9SPHN|nr:M50 family metallopeptidase [Sphingomonas hankyongi]MCL6730501.1 M50 family metallopeptidase [Sphingomonas hankyongi]
MLSQPPLWLVLIAFVCALGPLVFFHELGHYLVGRWFKVPAEVFSIGFGREILGWTDRQGTRWKVGWLPLGGYVKFVGDMNAASVPGEESDVPEEFRDRAFQFRPAWQRFLIVLAGPMANFLLAILIFAAFFTFVGTPRTNVIGAVQAGSAAATGGIQAGDRIISVAGRDTPSFDDIFNVVAVRPGETVDIAFERGGAVREVEVKLGSDYLEDASGQKQERGLLGVYPGAGIGEPIPVYRAVPLACDYTWRLTRSIADGLVQLIRGAISPKQLGGPIKIAQVAGQGVELGLLPFVQLMALFSINLGFINLLPVPMLDGGHLLFYAVEAVRRRPISARALDWAFRGGLALILALLIFTTVNDLGSLGLWDRLQRLIG